MSRRPSVLALVAAGLLGACAHLDEPTPPPQQVAVAYTGETVDGRPIRRVVVLPLHDLTGHPEQTVAVQQALVDELQKRQAFEVVALDPACLSDPEEAQYFRAGEVRKETLLRMAARFHADGVLYGALTRYRAYEPMALGLQLTLVSAGAGDVVWSSNALFDAADARVVQDVHNFHDTRLADSESLEGWRIVLLSPSRFTSYACARVVDTLEQG